MSEHPHSDDIGVVVPAYNREATIERALASILGQTRPPERVVVVDDGSTDSTPERARSFGDAVTVLEQPNSGPSAARNRAVAELDTRWVAFLDSDDYWEPQHLARVAAAMDATGGAAEVYFSDAVTPDLEDGTTWWQECGFDPHGEIVLREDATDWVMRPLHPFLVQATVLDRRRYLEVGGMWTRLRTREDTHLYFVMGLGRPMCAVAGVGAVLTSDDTSGQRLTQAAGTGTRMYDDATVALYDDVLERFPELAAGDRKELELRKLSALLSSVSAQIAAREPSALRTLAQAVRLAPLETTKRGFSRVFR